MKGSVRRIIYKLGLVILFVILINWTVNFRLFNGTDLRALAILLSCTGILVLLGSGVRPDSERYTALFRFNLFLTGILMSVLMLFSTTVHDIQSLMHPGGALKCFKPLLFSLIVYLPGVNILSALNTTIPEPHEGGLDLTALPLLTRREREVFDLALLDLSNKDIGDKLFIAESTVKKHMQSILKKSDCCNKAAMIEKYGSKPYFTE